MSTSDLDWSDFEMSLKYLGLALEHCVSADFVQLGCMLMLMIGFVNSVCVFAQMKLEYAWSWLCVCVCVCSLHYVFIYFSSISDEEYQFLILDEKISKVAPKKWKTAPGEVGLRFVILIFVYCIM